MAPEWNIGKSKRECFITGRILEPGEAIYSALVEEGETFCRQDYSLDSWKDAEKDKLFSFWKTKVSDGESKNKRLVIDVEAFYTFFTSLDGEKDRNRQLFRYLTALILIRKRVLRLEEIEKEPDGDVLVIWDIREKKQVRVFGPTASKEDLEQAQQSLDEIFDCQVSDEL